MCVVCSVCGWTRSLYMPHEMLNLVYLLNVMTDVYGANSCATRCYPNFHTDDSLVGISTSTPDNFIEDYRGFNQILKFNNGLLLRVGNDGNFQFLSCSITCQSP
jgi:hypothetical protein